MRKRRVWTEFLSPEMLGAKETIDLLQRYQLQPLIAMPPRRTGPEMGHAIRSLHHAGVPIGIWPLLPDSDGYWPSTANAGRGIERVREVLGFAEAAQVPIQTVAMDLEPGLARKREFQASSAWRRAGHLRAQWRRTPTAESRAEFAAGEAHYQRLASELREAGIESLAIAVPPLALDLAAGSAFWQAFFETPLTGPAWDIQSPMFYRSMIQQALPGRNPVLARAIFAEACRLWIGRGGRTCMSLGVVGPGKLADEASYESAAELAWDVACAEAAGLDDLALFSLESVLNRPNPEAWLAAFTQPSARLEVPLLERVARTSVRGLLACAARLTPRL